MVQGAKEKACYRSDSRLSLWCLVALHGGNANKLKTVLDQPLTNLEAALGEIGFVTLVVSREERVDVA